MKSFSPITTLVVAVVLSAASLSSSAADLAAGGYHSLLVSSGQIKALGDGTYGQLGTAPAGAPATVAGLSGVTDVAAGGYSTLALKSDGTVWMLGETTVQHTTPHGTPNPISTPVQVAGLSGIDAIAAGHRHYLALDADTGNLYAWGHNGSGQVGNGGLLDVTTPVLVLANVAAISAGDGFSLAVKTDNTLWSWGRNTHGQLGQGNTADLSTPTPVAGVTTASKVAAGGQHSLVLLTGNTLLAMGNNSFGQLGLGTTISTSTPTAVQGLSAMTAVSAGYFHSAGLTASQVSLWGRNHEGQCGGGSSSSVSYSSPQVLTGLPTTPVSVSCGYHFTIFKLSDNTTIGTGSNSDGQLDGISVADQDGSPKFLSPEYIPLLPIPADHSAPAPDPMTFSVAPVGVGGNSVAMTATTATDFSDVEYYFESTTIGGNDSGWQDSPSYTDTGLSLSTSYSYRVQARDKSPNQNTTAFSTTFAATTSSEIMENSSFEADENISLTGGFADGGRDDFGGQLTGWIAQSGDINDVSVGWKDITASELDPNPAEGGQESQALSLISGSSVLNTTGVTWSSLNAGDQLTLTISLGMRSAAAGLDWNEGTFFGITDSGANLSSIELADTIANSGVIANNPATGTQAGDGTFTDVSFTHTVVAADLSRNGNIGILINSVGGSGDTHQSFFDHVRLVVTPFVDNTAPTPDPMTFSVAPVALSGTSVTMTATTATDLSGVEYYFESTTAGGNDSGWQDSPTYTDTGLTFGTAYSYRVRARDKAASQNPTAYSAEASATTSVAAMLINHSFETDENTSGAGGFADGEQGDFGGQLTGWIAQSGDINDVSVGWKDITASELDPNPAEGGQESQALSLISGSSLLNTTGVTWSSLNVGDQLTLTISLGMRTAAAGLNWNEGTFFGITDSDANLTTIELADTIANSGVIANNPATGTQAGDGTFTDVSFTHTVVAADLSRNGNIGILINSVGGSGATHQSFFDHVRLDVIPNNFITYITNPAYGIDPVDQGLSDDPDSDGMSNGIENWFGTHPGVHTAGLANLATTGTVTTFTHPQNTTLPSDLTGSYEWSPNLVDWYSSGSGASGGATVSFTSDTSGSTTTVTATASETVDKFFLHAKVTSK